MINHGNYIIHVFVFISSDYSTIAVKSSFCPVVFTGPWIIKCFFNNYDTDTGISKISIKPHTFTFILLHITSL